MKNINVVITEAKYKAIKRYIKINVKNKSGKETMANIYRKLGISRTSLKKITTGLTKRVKAENWLKIEKLLGDLLPIEERFRIEAPELSEVDELNRLLGIASIRIENQNNNLIQLEKIIGN